MATLRDLASAGVLDDVIDFIQLAPRELPQRRIYASRGFASWVDDFLPYSPPDRCRKELPLEQLENIFHSFIIGWQMSYGKHLKLLEPLRDAVWEMRTVDIRIIGYIARKGAFVAVRGDMKRNLKKFQDYSPHVAAVRMFRNSLPLDRPKYLPGRDLSALI